MPTASSRGSITAKSSWQWPFYKPVIALAMEYKLPLLAANLSRADAGKVIQGGLAAALDAGVVNRYGLDKPLPGTVLSAQVEEVRTGHCGMLPEEMLEPMARAQVARDVVMAETLRPFASRGVVLIAGNGHVRRDIAVPYWLHAQGLTTMEHRLRRTARRSPANSTTSGQLPRSNDRIRAWHWARP